MKDNPFEVLQLGPEASEEEVVRRAGQLRQRSADEETLTAVRQAVQVLTGKPAERVLHALLTHPQPGYDRPALDRLESAFRRPPQAGPTEPSPPPEFDLREFAALLRPLLLSELASEGLPFEMPLIEETEEEICRQAIEGVWQVLPFEPLG